MSNEFEPTHEIEWNGGTFPVRLVDGVCYTREEWDNDSSADWTFDLEEGLRFQGEVPVGDSEIRALT